MQDALVAGRADLTEAQRSRAELQDRLTRVNSELEKLRKRSVQDGRRIKALEGDRTNLQLRLKDRDEELRGKAKLLDVCSLSAVILLFVWSMSLTDYRRTSKMNWHH